MPMQSWHSDVALNWVGGKWVDSTEHRPVFDPATGNKIGTFALGDTELVQRAVDSADKTFRESDWRHDRQLRAKVLNSMADRVEQRQKELVGLLALNNGKITPEATFEVSMVPSKLRWWAAMALTEHGRASAMPGQRTSIVVREPAGVAGIIVPPTESLGGVLIQSPKVPVISFTGSTATGRRISA